MPPDPAAYKARASIAEEAARDLLASTLPLMKAPPVSLSVICDWLGVEVYTRPCDSFGAIFVRPPNDGKKFLMVNSNLRQGRFRFSIAHELGHIFLNHEPLRHIFEYRPEAERQADSFAAELLMPETLLRADRHIYSPQELTRRYRVSLQSLELRLRALP